MSPLLRARVAGQAGLVTRAQLLGAGWTYEMIRWRVSSGRWVRVHPGVYLTTPGRDDWELRAVAALLAVGSPSCLFGQSAGEAWGLVPRTEPASDQSLDDVSVVVPFDRGAATVDGITVSRSRHFAARVHPTEWPHRTTVEHTVLDLALGHGVDRCIALMAKACQLRLTNESALAKALEDRPTQPYRRLLREALGLVAGGAESAAEVRYIRDVEQAHGLPSGVRQEPAPGSRSRDSEYPGFGVIVEIDGRLGHVGWVNQQRAGRRDRKAAATGRLTVRGGWSDVAASPCEFAADLSEIFASRGWRGRGTPCGAENCNLLGQAA